MRLPKALFAALTAGCLAACAVGGSAPGGRPVVVQPAPVHIGNVLKLRTSFGPSFKVMTVGPAGIDPKLLAPQSLPDGVTVQPAECAQYTGQTLPSGLKGNMATVLAEGDGNRFIVIALETSEAVPFDQAAADKCRRVAVSGPSLRGAVDVVDAPHIDGVQTTGSRRVLQAAISGAVGAGELFTYTAYLGRYQVIVTADPLVAPNQPVAPVNIQRAQQLLTDAVAAVRS